jgi:hypothetical protein
MQRAHREREALPKGIIKKRTVVTEFEFESISKPRGILLATSRAGVRPQYTYSLAAKKA